jgi:hypothetical protein
MTRTRLRDLGIVVGELPTGPYNAITDVPGVWVGHTTLIYDQPRVARTGVTVIRPRYGEIYQDQCFAGYHSFNGNGEMTGLLWLEESGQLGAPIAITNTHQVGIVRDALVDYEARHHPDAAWLLPVVAETYDGWLNDINGFHLTHDHVFAALDAAASGPVAEGNVGGGTGMICHDFKAGIGTASRVVEIAGASYTVGVLVQANYGDRRDLRVDGTSVGRAIDADAVPLPWESLTRGRLDHYRCRHRCAAAGLSVSPPGTARHCRAGARRRHRAQRQRRYLPGLRHRQPYPLRRQNTLADLLPPQPSDEPAFLRHDRSGRGVDPEQPDRGGNDGRSARAHRSRPAAGGATDTAGRQRDHEMNRKNHQLPSQDFSRIMSMRT